MAFTVNFDSKDKQLIQTDGQSEICLFTNADNIQIMQAKQY